MGGLAAPAHPSFYEAKNKRHPGVILRNRLDAIADFSVRLDWVCMREGGVKQKTDDRATDDTEHRGANQVSRIPGP